MKIHNITQSENFTNEKEQEFEKKMVQKRQFQKIELINSNVGLQTYKSSLQQIEQDEIQIKEILTQSDEKDKKDELVDDDEDVEMIKIFSADELEENQIDQNEKKQILYNQDMLLKIKNYQPTFRWGIFLEFTFYHFVYLGMLGPFSQLLFYYHPGIPLMKSLLFNKISGVGLNQFFQYMLNFIVIFIYFLYKPQYIYFYGEIINGIMGMLFRCMGIGIKYATFDPEYIEIIKNIPIDDATSRKKNFLADWKIQQNRMVYEEIKNQVGRFQIDESLLFIEFMVPVNSSSKNNMSVLQEEFKNINKIEYNIQHPGIQHKNQKNNKNNNNQSEFPPKSLKFLEDQIENIQEVEEKENYFGYLIIADLIKKFQEQKQYFQLIYLLFTILYSLFKSFLPSIVRYLEGKPIIGETWQDVTVIFCCQCSLNFYYWPILLIIFTGLIDIQRLNFLQIQFAMMLAPIKLKDLDEQKLYPTINLTTPIVLKGWQLCRKICFDYGKSYNLRLQANATVALSFCVIGLILLVANLFTKEPLTDNAQMVSLFSDSLVLGLIFLALLYQAAQLNNQYQLILNILRENKNMFMDFEGHADVYFNNKFQAQNLIQKYIIKQLKLEFQNDLKKIHDHLNKIIKVFDSCINEIEIEKEINPFKILGVKVTMTMLGSIGTALVTSIGTILAAYFKIIFSSK